MDQVKEILRQAIKYRFWIAVGISLLFPAIAYVLGSGPIQEQAKAQTTAIEGAKKDVDQYASGDVKNNQYKPIIDKKTADVAKEVRKSWQKLYDRQAPLLTWPERVQERFRKWGRKWPEDVDASNVQFAIIDYVTAYPKHVTEVYESFHPFNYEDGSGVVAAPPESMLLKPAPFKETQLPDLGKVWAAQERLWVQRALLEVIAEVNKNAKGWDTGIIKAIKALEVGTQNSQDQVSMVDGKTLVEAEPITDPKAPPPADTTSSAPAGMEGMMAMMGSSGGGTQKNESVFYIATEGGDAAKYKIMPVEMAVLIDQERIQDFLAALENSPMAIQVKEFSMSRPTERVTKPEKGDSQSGYGYFGSGSGDMRSMMQGMRMGGYGGMAGMMNMQRRAMAYGGQMGAYGPGASTKSGVDKRSVDRRKKNQEEQDKEKEEGKTKRQSLHDPYFNIVEVTVYGQVRFYNPPPPEEPSAEESASPGENATPAAEGEAKKEGEPAKTEGEKPATKEGEAPAAKDEAAAPKEKEKGDEAPAKDEAKPDEGDAAKKDDAAKEKAPEEPAKGKDADAPKSDEGETKGADDSAPAKK